MHSLLVAVLFVLLGAPLTAGAHEVYVLGAQTIAQDIAAASPNPFDAFNGNESQFFLWGFIAVVLVTTVFAMSITHRLEVLFEPLLRRLKPYAPVAARVTLGLCLMASAYNGALFGPELPLAGFGAFSAAVVALFYTAGVLLIAGYFTRIAAAAVLAVFAASVLLHGWYMLTYVNYVGEILLALFLLPESKKYESYAFLALRVGFGVSVAFASIYAKFIHSNLALSVVSQYHLTNIFPFDPLFIVLGACIIEVLMGLFFIFGVEIRHTALFFLFWIFLSLLYFGESVWPHLVLVGVNLALIMYGYDRLSLEGRLFNRGNLEPVL